MIRIGRQPAEQEKQSFGEQAARFSLYVPVAVIMIGCFSRSSSEAGVALAWLNVALIVAGFLLGIVALVSMKKFGPERILGRAIGGIVLNGLAIALLLSVLAPLRGAAALQKQVAGHWRLQSGADKSLRRADVTLKPDGSFTFDLTRQDGASISTAGTWRMAANRVIGLTIDRVTGGDASAAGKKVGLGRVKKVDDKQLVLDTDTGEQVYQRVP